MSDFQDFLHSRILRHPTTWLVAIAGGIHGGLARYNIREAKRAAGAELQFSSLWLERSVDVMFGAGFQILLLFWAVWVVAGLMEHTNAWKRQTVVFALYLGFNWLKHYL